MRAEGEELRVAGGATGVRGGVTAVDVEAADAIRPFSARASFSFAEDPAAEEFALTKRCSCGS